MLLFGEGGGTNTLFLFFVFLTSALEICMLQVSPFAGGLSLKSH